MPERSNGLRSGRSSLVLAQVQILSPAVSSETRVRDEGMNLCSRIQNCKFCKSVGFVVPGTPRNPVEVCRNPGVAGSNPVGAIIAIAR